MAAEVSMVSLVEEYLTSRRRLGYVLRAQGFALFQFARHADKLGYRGPLTTDLAVGWAKLPENADRTYWARRLEIVRGFARYRALFDPCTEIPPDGLLGPSRRRALPHIYSPDEIMALIQAASNIDPPGILKRHTYTTLLGLLICTGMRISEALRLEREDVDLNTRILTIKLTKFRKSRLVPVHTSTAIALSRYSEQRNRYFPLTTSKMFFIGERGTALKYAGVLRVFVSLRNALKWTNKPGRKAPRIHDLRHTFAVRRLLRWYQEGVDVNRKIASLSTYLGHVMIEDTYWYLTGVPELMALSASRFERFAQQHPGGSEW